MPLLQQENRNLLPVHERKIVISTDLVENAVECTSAHSNTVELVKL